MARLERAEWISEKSCGNQECAGRSLRSLKLQKPTAISAEALLAERTLANQLDQAEKTERSVRENSIGIWSRVKRRN